jgi:hypothetical protein
MDSKVFFLEHLSNVSIGAAGFWQFGAGQNVISFEPVSGRSFWVVSAGQMGVGELS